MEQTCSSARRPSNLPRSVLRSCWRWYAALLAAWGLMAAPASAQDLPPLSQLLAAQQTQVQPPVQPDGTIIVLGGDLPTDVEVMSSFRSISRGLSANAQMFLRCAELPGGAALSTILDGSPQLRRTQSALHRFIQKNEGCYPGMNRSMSVPELGRCNPVVAPAGLIAGAPSLEGMAEGGDAGVYLLCRAVYDRGALYEQALLQRGGSLDLDWDDTFDPAVRGRFMRRENARNDGRLQIDRNYFDTVACMVQISPHHATALIEAQSGSNREADAVTQLVGHGSPCVGYAKNVRFDQAQFRAYVAEALYSWLAAKRGVGSLVLRGVTFGS